MAAASPVQPVMRAFRLLEVLNRKVESSIGELHEATGLPKPTIIRLLGTLVAAGYATRISSQAGYRITEQVRALSSGLRFIDRMVDAAAPAMREFTLDHAWPVGLAKIRDGVIVLLHNTAAESPLMFDSVVHNMTYQLMHSAVGLAYLAFCSSEERRRLIREVLPDTELGQFGLRDARDIEAHLAAIRRRGYAAPLMQRPLKMLGIAIPVRRGRQIIACLVMRFPRSVMTPEEAAERYLTPLNATARAIAKALDAQDSAA